MVTIIPEPASKPIESAGKSLEAMDIPEIEGHGRTNSFWSDDAISMENYWISDAEFTDFDTGMPQPVEFMAASYFDNHHFVQNLGHYNRPVTYYYDGDISPNQVSTIWAGSATTTSSSPDSPYPDANLLGRENLETLEQSLDHVLYPSLAAPRQTSTHQQVHTQVSGSTPFTYDGSAASHCSTTLQNVMPSNHYNQSSASHLHSGLGDLSTHLAYGGVSTTHQLSRIASMAGQTRTRFHCNYCMRSFKREPDRIRHENTIHLGNQGQPLLCPIANCPRSRGQEYSRLDKLKEHLWRKHGNLGYTKRG